ncbi:hypothetical protein AB0D74_41875 [Streptomyces sp. NPDC048278]|uniref:hypothetical protein n=1 Tax=Streptomyces sp. NPDC048278 TaxID=3155809 RepID=UPI00341FE219
MLRTVTAGLDGAPGSRAATAWAAREARLRGPGDPPAIEDRPGGEVRHGRVAVRILSDLGAGR